MICLNEMCIFQASNRCKLENISIDEHGRCVNWIYPEFDKAMLERRKFCDSEFMAMGDSENFDDNGGYKG